jgi:altronate hydrolase
MKDKIIINKIDNVGVCLKENGEIPAGHKFALCDIKSGENIIKYGQIIGKATKDINQGEWVHTHNVKSHLDESFVYTYNYYALEKKKEKTTFKGFKRVNGRAGIRNEIYIIPTVGCVNNVCIQIERQSQKFKEGTIDGIFALTHQFGCSQLGADNENIKKLLCSVALNPNASFVLFVGLGCENNGLDGIKEYLKPFNRDNIMFFNCQDVENEVEYGLNIIRNFASKAKDLKREEVDLAELCIGLKCGGSDGYSGLTANPLVGKITDKIVSFGGSAILTEVPEMFGAETILMSRCQDEATFDKTVHLINDFKAYFMKNDQPVYENPSPGNKAGGISTLEEKSLGCTQKSGNSIVRDVLLYGDRLATKGLNLLSAPGNDLVASTALAAAGCQIVLFTTGRGTPFGTFVPTAKISTNTTLAANKPLWIDFNAGEIVEGRPVEDVDKDFIDFVLGAASGTLVNNEKSGYSEIAIFKSGVTL